MTVTRQRVNQRALTIAARLEQLAPLIATAKEHITRQLANTDGYPGGGNYQGSRSTDATSTVERTLIRRHTIHDLNTQINDDLDTIDKIITSTHKTCNQALGHTHTETARCDARHLDGYHLAITDNGWSDPTCTRIPRRGNTGPCDACYMRHIRWRTRNNLPPLKDTPE